MQSAINIFCLLAMVAVFVQATPTPEQMKKIQAAKAKCKPQTGATDEDIASLMAHKMPETKTGQCFIACMNKEFGVMTADNKIDVENIKTLTAPLKEKDAEKYEKGMKVIESCAGEVNGESDECVLAKKMIECTKKQAEAMGLLMQHHEAE